MNWCVWYVKVWWLKRWEVHWKKNVHIWKANDCTLSMLQVITPTSEGSPKIVQMKTLFHVLPHGCPMLECEIMHGLFVSLGVLNWQCIDLILLVRSLLKIQVTSNWNWYILGTFWNPLYNHPWTIPKTISKMTTSFLSLATSFLS